MVTREEESGGALRDLACEGELGEEYAIRRDVGPDPPRPPQGVRADEAEDLEARVETADHLPEPVARRLRLVGHRGIERVLVVALGAQAVGEQRNADRR